MQASCSIQHQDVKALQLCRLHGAFGDVDRLLPSNDRQSGDINLRAQRRQLLLRRRTIDVERCHQHLFALFILQQLGNFGGCGGFTRTLQTDHHDDRRRRNRKIQFAGIRPQHFDKRVVDDFYDLLTGRHGF